MKILFNDRGVTFVFYLEWKKLQELFAGNIDK